VTEPFAELNAALPDHYIIDRELGRGGMAIVYLARDTRHDRFVALKTLRPEIAIALGGTTGGGGSGRDRFLREIKLAARLQHPNILPVFDSGDAGGTLYYVMPFVEGESLRDRLDREPQLPVDDALQIAREVAEALAYAHDHDVVHRDIKPENIMMSGGHAIVTDFGIARAVSAAGGDKLTQTGLAIGTPAYMPPEQASGSGQVDRRSDIYSLACVLYETLAGQPPFTGPTAQAIMARHSLDAVPRLKIVRDAIPDDLEVVIERALEKVPADRYQTSGEFAKALTQASTGTVSRVTAARRPTRARMLGRRSMTVAVGLGAIVVIAGAWLLLGRRNKNAARADLPQNRVAVLYFSDQSRDSSLRYLADGLTESLIEQLAPIRALDVVSRNGVAPFRGKDAPRDSVARVLGAGTLVEGEVEPVSAGARARVTVRLVDGASGVDVRRQSFELPLNAPLAMRDSVASQAALFLRERIGDEVRLREERAGTKSVDAWTLVQQAQKAQKDAGAATLNDPAGAAALYARSDSLLAGAEAADPSWVDPTILRARVAYLRARMERQPKDIEKWATIGLGHAEQALRVEPQNPDALEIRGTLRFWRYSRRLEPDSAGAERLLAAAQSDLETATRINPQQVGAWNILSYLYYQRHDPVEANRAARSAYESDAFLSSADAILFRLFVTSYDLELFTPAKDWCDKGHRRFPNNPQFVQCQLMLLSTNAADPDVPHAWDLATETVRLTPEKARPYGQLYQQIFVAAVLARAGLADSARRVLERSRGNADIDPGKELLGYEAFVRVMLGDKDEALRLLSEYFTANPSHREGFRENVHWWWRPIQNDPRFKQLIGAT
jgi:eukaryotic-like serine/threonine-protein kinase